MKKILIIKTGNTLSSLIKKRGDFEDYIKAGMGIPVDHFRVVDVADGEKLPGYHAISGIVITGSHSMVTDHERWSEETAAWLKRAVQHQLPTLGICYGHQLLAHSLGGEVGDNVHGGEFGTVEVTLNKDKQTDRLFNGFPDILEVHACHSQSVIKLPENVKLLGSSKWDRYQAFVYEGSAWGVQFHPEFDQEITTEYIQHFSETLIAAKKDPERLIKNTKNTPFGTRLLKKFAELI